MKIKIKINGLVHDLECDPNDEVSDLRKKISDEFNVADSRMRLIFKGKILKVEPGETLEKLGMKEDDIIHVAEKKEAPNVPPPPAAKQQASDSIPRPPPPPPPQQQPRFPNVFDPSLLGDLGSLGALPGGINPETATSILNNLRNTDPATYNALMEQTQQMLSNPEAVQQMLEMYQRMSGVSPSQMPAHGSRFPYMAPPPPPPAPSMSQGMPTLTDKEIDMVSKIINVPAETIKASIKPAVVTTLRKFFVDINSLRSAGINAFPGLEIPSPYGQQEDPGTLYASQLSQMEDMGFNDREKNIVALRRCNGDIQSAIDLLLRGGDF